MTREQGVSIRTSSPVARIIVDPATKKATGVELEGGEVLEADIVVSAADLHHTETQLLPAELQTYPQEYWDKKTAGPSALLLYLGVKGELPELEHHTLLFTANWRENFEAIFGPQPTLPDPASLYICKPSGVDPSVAPEGHENVFVLVPAPADLSFGRGDVDGDGDTPLEVYGDRIIAQIADWAKIPDLADRIVVRRTYGPGNFKRRPQRVAWHRAGPGAHPLAECILPRGQRLEEGRPPLLRGRLDDSGHWLADVPHQRRGAHQAFAR